jgi:general stress protein 26
MNAGLTPEKTSQMNAFLAQPLLARLATADPLTLQPHVVPVWYAWDGVCLWFSGFRSTRKFKELSRNPRCAVVIDATQNNLDNSGVLFKGVAEWIDSPRELVYEKTTWIYTRYLGPEGVLAPDPQSWIHDPENVLIRLKPEKVHTWFP